MFFIGSLTEAGNVPIDSQNQDSKNLEQRLVQYLESSDGRARRLSDDDRRQVQEAIKVGQEHIRGLLREAEIDQPASQGDDDPEDSSKKAPLNIISLRRRGAASLSGVDTVNIDAALDRIQIWEQDERTVLAYITEHYRKPGATMEACVKAGWMRLNSSHKDKVTAITRACRLCNAAVMLGRTIRPVADMELEPFRVKIDLFRFAPSDRKLRRRAGKRPAQQKVEKDREAKEARIQSVGAFDGYGLDPLMALYLLDMLHNLNPQAAIRWSPAWTWPGRAEFQTAVEVALADRTRGLMRDNLATLAIVWLQGLLRWVNSTHMPRRRAGLRSPNDIIGEAVGQTFGLSLSDNKVRERAKKLKSEPPVDLLSGVAEHIRAYTHFDPPDDNETRRTYILNNVENH